MRFIVLVQVLVKSGIVLDDYRLFLYLYCSQRVLVQ